MPPLRRGLVAAAALAVFTAASGLALAAHDGGESDSPTAQSDLAPTLDQPSTSDRAPQPSRSSERPGQQLHSGSPSESSTPSPRTADPTTQDPTLPGLPSATVPSKVPTTVPPEAPKVPTTAPSQSRTSTSQADRSAPQTTASTASSDGRAWAVALGANEPATFECSLDGGGFSPCSASVTFDDLEPGHHTLAARATDTAGNTDPTPARLDGSVNAGG